MGADENSQFITHISIQPFESFADYIGSRNL
jgi:hypothetical protein